MISKATLLSRNNFSEKKRPRRFCVSYPYSIVKVKGNRYSKRYRPGVAQRVGRGIALLFLYRGTRRG